MSPGHTAGSMQGQGNGRWHYVDSSGSVRLLFDDLG